MKAFLLAAGKGTRMKPLADTLPKCLVKIDHRCLLQIWLETLEKAGISEVLINTHHLAEKVTDFLKNAASPLPAVHVVHEPELLGSAGTVAANRGFIDHEEAFFIIYADNLTLLPLKRFLQFHREKRSVFSMALFRSAELNTCGVATLDKNDKIIGFVEKPSKPESIWANAGVYLASPTILDHLQPGKFADFGFDVLPLLVGRMYGFRYEGLFHDIGTLARLEKARLDWARHMKKENHSSC